MYHGRLYLRLFDGDENRIYSVVSETMKFREVHESIPVTPFVTGERKKGVVDLFMDRMTGQLLGQGGRIRHNLLHDINFIAMLLDPIQSLEDHAPFHCRFYRHISAYAANNNPEMAHNLRQALIEQYTNIRFLILSQRQTVEGRRRQHDLRNHPML